MLICKGNLRALEHTQDATERANAALIEAWIVLEGELFVAKSTANLTFPPQLLRPHRAAPHVHIGELLVDVFDAGFHGLLREEGRLGSGIRACLQR